VETMVRFVRHVMRMSMPWPLWVAVLLATNMGAIFVLPRVEGVVVLGGLGLGAMLQLAIFERLGFVRLLGLGHLHWFAMVPWLLSRLETIAEPSMHGWVVAVSVVCGLSLVLDTIDVVRYLGGERARAVVLQGVRA
jgi:hypothetical protein